MQYKDFVPISYPYLISEEVEIVRACDRHRNKTATLRKHVIKYKYMQMNGRIYQQISESWHEICSC